jgi:hypothetical protein
MNAEPNPAVERDRLLTQIEFLKSKNNNLEREVKLLITAQEAVKWERTKVLGQIAAVLMASEHPAFNEPVHCVVTAKELLKLATERS